MKTDILREISQANLSLLEKLGPSRTYEKVVKELQKLMNSDDATVFLLQNEHLRRVYSTVPRKNRMRPRKNGNTHRAIKERKPIVVNEGQIRRTHPESQDETKTIVIMPLLYGKSALGALTVQYRESIQITQEYLDVLQLYASVAAFAIRNAELMKNLRKTLAVRDLFISTASHELKTPLTAISLYSNLLKKSADGKKKINTQWINNLSEQVVRLNNMFEDFLSLEKMRMDELEYRFTTFSVNKLITKAIENFHIKHGLRKIDNTSQTSHKSLKITGDFDKLLQVVNNILNNAAKFSRVNGDIIISVEPAINKFVKITVRDNGVGIDKKDIPKIFQKYYTTKTHNKEGMGIGMYLTKKIIAKHKGTIKIESEKGIGTSVLIYLPES